MSIVLPNTSFGGSTKSTARTSTCIPSKSHTHIVVRSLCSPRQSHTSHRYLQYSTRLRCCQGNNIAERPERLRYIIALSSHVLYHYWRHTSTAVHTAPSYHIIHEPPLRSLLRSRHARNLPFSIRPRHQNLEISLPLAIYKSAAALEFTGV